MVVDLNHVYVENILNKKKEIVGVEAVNKGAMTSMIGLSLNKEVDNNMEEEQTVI